MSMEDHASVCQNLSPRSQIFFLKALENTYFNTFLQTTIFPIFKIFPISGYVGYFQNNIGDTKPPQMNRKRSKLCILSSSSLTSY